MHTDQVRTGVGLALGTVVSRLTGYLRSVLLVAALGSSLHADLFSIANTIPNMLVILLGGGVFNAVLVPQLVRADRDGEGRAFVDQVITLFGGFLLVATVVLTLAAPWLVDLYLSPALAGQAFAAQHASALAFAYLCLPQVFLYGAFGLLGQVLNARGVFGPMMWAPVLNNLVAIAVLGSYLLLNGTVTDGCAGFTSGQERLLGLGTTAAVLVQCIALLPYLRQAGVRYRPTLRLGSPRLRATLRLGGWTLAVVAVNQAAYGVVVRLASGGAVTGSGCAGPGSGTGYTVYSSAYLLIMAPHAVVTVSLMTASLPAMARLAARGRSAELGHRLAASLRLVLALIVPMVVLLELVRAEVAELVWGYGAGTGSSSRFVATVGWFAVALVFFTSHYVALRGLYALEANRAVLGIQLVIAVVNVVGAVILVRTASGAATAPALAAAYAVAYAVGSAMSWSLLRRRLGGIDGRRTVRSLVRLTAATGLAAAGTEVLRVLVRTPSGAPVSHWSAVGSLLVATSSYVVLFVMAGLVFGIKELRELGTSLLGRR